MEYSPSESPNQQERIEKPRESSIVPENARKTSETHAPKNRKLANHLRRLFLTCTLAGVLNIVADQHSPTQSINQQTNLNSQNHTLIASPQSTNWLVTRDPSQQFRVDPESNVVLSTTETEIATEANEELDTLGAESTEIEHLPGDLLGVHEHIEPQSSKLLLTMVEGKIEIFDQTRTSPTSEVINLIWSDSVSTRFTYEVVPDKIKELAHAVGLQNGDRLFAVNKKNLLVLQSNDGTFSMFYYDDTEQKLDLLIDEMQLSDLEKILPVLQIPDADEISSLEKIELLTLYHNAINPDLIEQSLSEIQTRMISIKAEFRFDYASLAFAYISKGDSIAQFFFEFVSPLLESNTNLNYGVIYDLTETSESITSLNQDSLAGIKMIFETHFLGKSESELTDLYYLMKASSSIDPSYLSEILQQHPPESTPQTGSIMRILYYLDRDGYTSEQIGQFVSESIKSDWSWSTTIEFGYLLTNSGFHLLAQSDETSMPALQNLFSEVVKMNLNEKDQINFSDSLSRLLITYVQSDSTDKKTFENIDPKLFYQYSQLFNIYQSNESYSIFIESARDGVELPTTEDEYVLAIARQAINNNSEDLAGVIDTIHLNESSLYGTDEFRNLIFESMSNLELYTFLNHGSFQFVTRDESETPTFSELAFTSTVLKAQAEFSRRGDASISDLIRGGTTEEAIMFAATMGRYGLLVSEVERDPVTYLGIFESAFSTSEESEKAIYLLTQLLSEGINAGLSGELSEEYSKLLIESYNLHAEKGHSFGAANIAFLILENKEVVENTDPTQFAEIASHWPEIREVTIPNWSELPVITVVASFNEETVRHENDDVYSMTQKILHQTYGYDGEWQTNDAGDQYLVKKLPSGQEIHFVLTFDNLSEVLAEYDPQLVAHLSHSYDREYFWDNLEHNKQRLVDGNIVLYDGSCGSAESELAQQFVGSPFFGIKQTGTGPPNIHMLARITESLNSSRVDWQIPGINIPSYPISLPNENFQSLMTFLTTAGVME
jgi:hypothetical protein